LNIPRIDIPRTNYSTRVDFVSGSKARAVTHQDMFEAPNSEVRTPWYRLWPVAHPVTLHVTIEHPDGARTVAEYPLQVRAGEFYMVVAAVYKRSTIPFPGTIAGENSVSYPLNSRVTASPGDSLWISYYPIGRECFGEAVCN
jgi:hypothetical protein